MRAVVNKFPYDATQNPPHLMIILPHLSLISNIDIVLTNQVEMTKHVVGALRLELDERNIIVGCNTVNLDDFKITIGSGGELDI